MSDEPLPAARARTFVLRVVSTEPEDCHGQAGEPGSADEWQVTFASLDELWANLRGRLVAKTGAAWAHLASDNADPRVKG